MGGWRGKFEVELVRERNVNSFAFHPFAQGNACKDEINYTRSKVIGTHKRTLQTGTKMYIRLLIFVSTDPWKYVILFSQPSLKFHMLGCTQRQRVIQGDGKKPGAARYGEGG